MKTGRHIFILGVVALGLFFAIPAFAQEPGPPCDEVEFFDETGHNVCDRFLDFFHARGGSDIFGFPITEQFFYGGYLVQYFQRVRMEYHPENPPDYQVQLGLLGDHFAPSEKKAPIPESERPKSNDRERKYFAETGHSVGFSFLKFYNKNGGLDVFGYPVTEFILENGRFVQYFQRALMEWNPNGTAIELHDLGTLWIEQHDDLHTMREPADSLIQTLDGQPPDPVVESLHATAVVKDAITGPTGVQVVWVYVYSQTGEPVEGATVNLVIHYPNIDKRAQMDSTDSKGHQEVAFELEDPPRGQLVVIDALVKYGDLLTVTAQTSFLPWW